MKVQINYDLTHRSAVDEVPPGFYQRLGNSLCGGFLIGRSMTFFVVATEGSGLSRSHQMGSAERVSGR
jgi:hypothetical protein